MLALMLTLHLPPLPGYPQLRFRAVNSAVAASSDGSAVDPSATVVATGEAEVCLVLLSVQMVCSADGTSTRARQGLIHSHIHRVGVSQTVVCSGFDLHDVEWSLHEHGSPMTSRVDRYERVASRDQNPLTHTHIHTHTHALSLTHTHTHTHTDPHGSRFAVCLPIDTPYL